MSANGELTLDELAPISGGVVGDFLGSGQLANDAAAAWNAFAAECRQHGAHVGVNGPDSAYRNLERQRYWRNYWCSRGACQNAAVPGQSNHGFGKADDTPSFVWALMRAYGAPFGWGPCSDAPWEAWHRSWCGGWHGDDPGPGHQVRHPTLRHGDSGGAVKRAQKHLRRWNLGLVRPDVDGDFGNVTERAVKQFQLVHGLKADGVIGAGTWAQLRQPDPFLDDERHWLNYLRLVRARVAHGHKLTAKQKVRIKNLKQRCRKRAASIKVVARDAGWKGQHRRLRYHVLRSP